MFSKVLLRFAYSLPCNTQLAVILKNGLSPAETLKAGKG